MQRHAELHKRAEALTPDDDLVSARQEIRGAVLAFGVRLNLAAESRLLADDTNRSKRNARTRRIPHEARELGGLLGQRRATAKRERRRSSSGEHAGQFMSVLSRSTCNCSSARDRSASVFRA